MTETIATPASAQRRGSRWRSSVAPPAAVLAAAVAAWLLTGVGIGDLALFCTHELAFVLVPGCLAYLALADRRPGALKLAAIGYALGSVLEILAFALTAAIHARAALWAYPPLTVAVSILFLRRTGRTLWIPRPGTAERSDQLVNWWLASVSVLALAYIAVAYFLSDPLPSRAGSVVYISDLVFHLGVAAEALHHWPIMDPKVAGTPLPYENFVYYKLAAVSQVTGIPLPTVLFRLYIVPLVLDIVALLACAGTEITRRRGVGVLAAALFVFVGALGLDSHDVLAFSNTVFYSLYSSPSYVLGLVAFLAALIVLYEHVISGPSSRSGWLLFTVLLVGCSGAKAAILPVVIGALVLYVAWQRRLERPAVTALLVTGVVFLATYWLIYAGETGGLHFHAPGTIRAMDVIQYAQSKLIGSLGQPLFWIGATVVGVFGFGAATLAGIPAALARGEVRRSRSTILLLSFLLASFVPFLLLSHKGGSQNFFTYYGICAASVLSAQGLTLLWDRARPLTPRLTHVLAASGLAWLAVLLAAAILPYVLLDHPRLGPLYALWFGLPLLALVVLFVLARRDRVHRALYTLMAAGALVLVGFLQTPLTTAQDLRTALRIWSTPYPRDSPIARGLTPALQQALAWIRENTPTSAVIAVNNQFSESGGRAPTYFYYSAFGERQVFLEGWEDTIAAASLTNPAVTPFPLRLAFNNAVFYNANPLALSVLVRRFHVSYLLVDREHGPVQPRLATLSQRVFANPGAIIYRVRIPGAA